MTLTSLAQGHGFRSVTRMAALVAVAIGSSAASAAPAPLVGAGSGKCLDVHQGYNFAVQLYTCNGGANQRWEFNAAGELRTLNGTRCLDARGQGAAAGTALVANVCNGAASQKWRRGSNGAIVGLPSNLCVDVKSASTANLAAVQLWTCHGGANQVWTGGGSTTDVQPPSVPANLRVTNLACRSATLSWSASTDNVGVAFYDVYHDGQLMTTVSGGTLSTALTMAPGVRWGLYVNARDAAGNVSQASTSLYVDVPQCSVDTQAPTPPTGLSGTVSGTAATLRWTASADNVAVTAYDIFRNDARVGSTSGTAYTDSGLVPNTTYRYQVAARDAQGNVSTRSTSLSLTTAGTCSSAVCAVQQAATETDLPWGLVTLPDGNVIYSRRDAFDLVRLNPTTGQKTVIGRVPNVQGTDGEGGVMGLEVTPGFPGSDPWIYILHTSPTDNRVVRIQYRNGALDLATHQVLLTGIGRNKYHNGGRLRFGPDGKLYVATGDAQNTAYAQDINNLAGKILRMNPDGSRPSDNPFSNHVWSYGHRNPQGLAFDSQGRLWEQEFGNASQDETNLIEKGGNYGWPNCEGTQSRGGSGCATPGYIAPKRTYATYDASCSGIAIVRDVLYVACLRGERVYRHVISGTTLTNSQELFRGTYGRLRTVEPSRDGGLWLTTTNLGDKDSTANNSNEKILKIVLGN